MRRALLLSVLVVVLSACAARPDQTAPFLGITHPTGGAVAKGRAVTVEGYAFDDTGVASVEVAGTEVLLPEMKGKRLVRFRFQLKAPQAGRIRVKVVAKDLEGHTTSRDLDLVLDEAPPRVTIERVEEVDGRLRIVGVASDDVEVDRVVVRYGETFSRLNLPKGKRVRFYAEVPAKGATIIAVDAVNQRTEAQVSP